METPNFDLDGIGITPDTISEDAKKVLSEDDAGDRFFITKPANVWVEEAAKRPTPKKLFGPLWYEGELCILFADTNTGKSILGVEIGDAQSSGLGIEGFKIESNPQTVLLCDFELSDKQFQIRYTDTAGTLYQFNDKFLRAEINSDGFRPDGSLSMDDYITNSLEGEIIRTGAKIIIIDNLTYLRTEMEKAKDALPLMKKLKELKKKYHLSILVLAHTPKRDMTKPITKNDLAGSKMLINFCDSAFALGESCQDKNKRYIKQIKQRNCEQTYDAENVIILEIRKDGSFLGLFFTGYGSEVDHIKVQSEAEKLEKQEKAIQLFKEGKNKCEIARLMSVSEGAVRKWLKKAGMEKVVPLVPFVPCTSSTNGTNLNVDEP